MSDVARRARRLLMANRVGSTEKVYPGYMSFEEGARPRWWTDNLIDEHWGAVLGVHEFAPGTREHAIVVAENALIILTTDAAQTVEYADIEGWDQLSKEAPSLSLFVRRKSGGLVELRFPRPGQAFAFVQFLGRAIWEHAKPAE